MNGIEETILGGKKLKRGKNGEESHNDFILLGYITNLYRQLGC